jgi:hypothetical protein
MTDQSGVFDRRLHIQGEYFFGCREKARTGEDRRRREIAFMQAQFHEPLCDAPYVQVKSCAVLWGSDWTTIVILVGCRFNRLVGRLSD